MKQEPKRCEVWPLILLASVLLGMASWTAVTAEEAPSSTENTGRLAALSCEHQPVTMQEPAGVVGCSVAAKTTLSVDAGELPWLRARRSSGPVTERSGLPWLAKEGRLACLPDSTVCGPCAIFCC